MCASIKLENVIIPPFPLILESNWGLPLAIAANLHTPYRIEIGIENIIKAKIEDKHGKGKKIFDNKLLWIIPMGEISCKLDEKFIHKLPLEFRCTS